MAIFTIVKSNNCRQAIHGVFTQAGLQVISSAPTYTNYLRMLQYSPSLVIMELPQEPLQYLQFIRVVRSNKQIQQIPFLLFGPAFDTKIVENILKYGANAYLGGHLDLKQLMAEVVRLMQGGEKEIKTEFCDRNQMEKSDMDMLFRVDISSGAKLTIMEKHIHGMLAFPATIANILRVTQSDNSGASDLGKVISSDPSVATEILKAANSAFFARGGRRILDIKEAVIRIGFAQTKDIAMSLSVFKVMQNRNYATGFSHIEYWFHSLSVAVIAERLAHLSGLVKREEAFIVGLLHDVGVLLFNEYFNRLFLEILDETTRKGLSFVNCQRHLFGVTHNDLMARLFASWQFPDALSRTALDLNTITEIDSATLLERPLSAIVFIADVMAKSLRTGHSADCCVELVKPGVLRSLRLPYGLQKPFISDIYNELNVYNSFMHIDSRTFPETASRLEHADKISVICHTDEDEQYSPIAEYLKCQGYIVSLSSSLAETLAAMPSSHAVVVTNFSPDGNAGIADITARQTLKFDPDSENQSELVPARVICLNPLSQAVSVTNNNFAFACRYPVDLRNIDMVLACFQEGHAVLSPTSEFGTLKPVLQSGASPDNGQRKILFIMADSPSRKRLLSLFNELDLQDIETIADGAKGVNMAKTTQEEYMLVVVDAASAPVPYNRIILDIKELPNQKRARYLVIGGYSVDRAPVMPLINAGECAFVSSVVQKPTIKETMRNLGILQKR